MSYPKVIVDTNKILAAILRPGRVRRTLLETPALFLAPRTAWREAEKHIEELAARKGIPRREIEELLEDIRREVIVEEDPAEEFAEEAQRIAGAFDLDDWPFIALALEHQAPIWTNDAQLIKHSLETKAYQALDTQALELHLQGKQGEAKAHLKKKYTTR